MPSFWNNTTMKLRHGSPSTPNGATNRGNWFPLSPRQMLTVGVTLFLLCHSLLIRHSLDQNARLQLEQGGGATQSIHGDWQEQWKLRRTTAQINGFRREQDSQFTNTHQHDHHDQQVLVSTSQDNTSDDGSKNKSNTIPAIRSWGANLTTTPLIFVHIGKAGGGTIRARFSAARPNFRHDDWRNEDPDAVYPVALNNDNGTGTTTPAYFCNSGHATFRSTPRELYEETLLCHATTPLGAAIACPEHMASLKQSCPMSCGPEDTACHQVYMGHNIVGAEWHWLPYKVLRKWWRDNFQAVLPADLFATYDQYLATLEPRNTDWCPYEQDGLSRPGGRRDYRDKVLPCSIPLAQTVDRLAYQVLAHLQQQPQNSLVPSATEDWSSLYASLPVMRTTIMREPWSWLVSKFFWQGNWHWHELECDNIVQAARLDGKTQRRRLEEEIPEEGNEDQDGDSWDGGFDGGVDSPDEGEGNIENNGARLAPMEQKRQNYRSPPAEKQGRQRPKHVFPRYHPDSTIVSDADGFGWAHRYAMLYILYLAGEDATARYEMGLMGTNEANILEQLERQAANNLRQSFAVVGLLHETDTYFDMLSARVQYLDMSLHPDIEGELHGTGANGYMAQCKKTFADPVFQQELKEASPAVAALERLYKVAVEVNRHQVRELAASPNVDPVVRERLQKVANQFSK